MRAFKSSPSMVVALIALLFAMAGTALSAGYVITSSAQIKDGAVTSSDVRNSSLTGSDIKDRSLTPSDFSGAVQGPQGPQGPQGASGPRGVPGAQGPAGADGIDSVEYRSASSSSQGVSMVFCQTGDIATGGGGYSPDGFITASGPIVQPGWRVEAKHADGTPAEVKASVACAHPGSQ